MGEQIQQTVIHPYHGIVLNNEKEETIDWLIHATIGMILQEIMFSKKKCHAQKIMYFI